MIEITPISEIGFFTVKEISKIYGLKEGILRSFILHRNKNGFIECMRKSVIGKIVIDNKLFEKWVCERKPQYPKNRKSRGLSKLTRYTPDINRYSKHLSDLHHELIPKQIEILDNIIEDITY